MSWQEREAELMELSSGPTLAVKARDLIRELALEDFDQSQSKIEKYASLAFRSFLAENDTLSAMSILFELKEIGISKDMLNSMELRLATAIGLKRKKPEVLAKETSQDSLQEVKARIVIEEFGEGDDLDRPQVDEMKISGIPFFSAWRVELLKEFFSQSSRVVLESGQILCEEEDEVDAFYLLTSGQLEMESRHGAKRYVDPGQFVGDLCLFIEEAHLARIEAKERSELIRFPLTTFSRLIEKHKHLKLWLRDWVYRKIFFLSAGQSPSFQGLLPVDWVRIGGFFKVAEVSARTLMKASNQEAGYFALILKGHVEVQSENGEASFYGPGSFIGEKDFIFKKASLEKWEASTLCHFMIFDRAAFAALNQEFSGILNRIEKSISNKEIDFEVLPSQLLD